MGNGADIDAAFDILGEVVDSEIDEVAARIGELALARQFTDSRALMDDAEWLQDFLSEITVLRSKWVARWPADDAAADASPVARRDLGRLPRGVRTPETAFYPHILQVLVDRGGEGQRQEVIDEVGRRMADVFGEHDHQGLPSNPQETRWRNTCAWARSELVTRGLMTSGERSGYWRITDNGRAWLSSAVGHNTPDVPPPPVQERSDEAVRARVTAATPYRIYQPYILQALVQLGGQAPRAYVLPLIRGWMEGILQPSDLTRYTTGSQPLVWEAMASTAVTNMKKAGFMASSRPGHWAITDEGRGWVARNPPSLP